MVKTFKDLRLASGKGAAQIAQEINIKENTYRKYECFCRLPRVETLIKLRQAYNCTNDEVLSSYEFHKQVYEKRNKN